MVPIKITILGCGTSTGVPTIGCKCAVCKSSHPKNKRLRSSIMITRLDDGRNIVIDTTPDFRAQMLRENVSSIEAVLYTHTHADHCHGFDDLRAFYFFSGKPIPCYLSREHLFDLKSRFSYAFEETGYLGLPPQVTLLEMESKVDIWSDMEIEVVRLEHGNVMSAAFRMGSFAYATDFKCFSESVLEMWSGKISLMVASGLRFSEHKTHSSIPETIQIFERLGVQRGIITHMAHEVEYEQHSQQLAPHIELAYDGMQIEHTVR